MVSAPGLDGEHGFKVGKLSWPPPNDGRNLGSTVPERLTGALP